MKELIQALVDSDMPTARLREHYLGLAKNVRAGHQAELELTGNAFNVTFSREGVRITSILDDDAAGGRMDLDEFIRRLSAWPAR